VRRRRIATALLVAIMLCALAVALGDAGGHGKGKTSARTDAGRAGEGRAASSSSSTRSRAAGGAAASGATAATGAEDVETPEIQHLIALGKPIYCAAPHGDEVALTFDDGPGQYTYLALPKLRKHHIKATFFIVGRNIPLGPRYLRQERELGAVGDHTFTHPLLTALAPGEAQAQIARTQQAVAQTSGSRVFLFRPPYGARNATIDSIARAHGLLEIMWTVDSRDSLGANYAEIERNVIEGLRPGSIILMHENHGQTIRAMLGIFAAVQRKHLRTVSVPRLLSDDPPSDAQVQAGGAGCGSLYRPGGSGG
jgi:peptidoglycan/xylan/chitin deacetylase (PgdA/CDA1 family)